MTVVDLISLLPLAALLTVAPAVTLSQTTDGSQSQHSVRGEVLNSVTHQPIANALVDLGRQQVAFTDREGKFEVDGVTDGYAIFPSVTKPGYFQQQRAFTDTNSLPTANQPLTLELDPEAILSGTVIDREGHPLQGLPVLLKTLQVFNGRRRWQQTWATTTNAEGEFRFAELQAGKYALVSGFQIDGLPDALSSVAYVPVVYPPVSGAEETSLTLAPGDHIEANLNPPVEKLYEVHGRIEGPPAEGVRVEVETSSGSQINPVFRFKPATGEFLLMLPGGGYRLKFHAYSPPRQLLGTREISINGANLRGLSVTLAPLASIPVDVEYQTTPTSSESKPPLMHGSGSIALEAAGRAGRPGQSFEMPAPNAAPGGPLSIQNLEPGSYWLQANPVAPWYLASASCGGVDLTHEPFTIAGGTAGCTMRVVLRNDSASLHWSLDTNNERSQSPSVFIYAIPLENIAQPLSTSSTQKEALPEGSLEDLAPGRYLVIAFDREQQLAYRETDALEKYSSLGKEVTLTPGGTSEVQLDLVNEQMVNREQ